jgi:UDP-N-acetylglucosamine acyltransferase
MAYCHVAHDCLIGNEAIFANGTSLAGHVVVGDHAIFGGFTMVHQFCRIGAHSFSAMGAAITKDVPPFIRVAGNVAAPYGLNAEGLKRRGFNPSAIANLRRAYKILYRSGLRLEAAVEELRAMVPEAPEVAPLVQFLADPSRRSIVR